MAGAAEASHTNARLTSKEKGKGRQKRPATGNISDGGDGNGEHDGDIVRITKRQATGRKSASGPTVPEVSRLAYLMSLANKYRSQQKAYQPDLSSFPFRQIPIATTNPHPLAS
jgi:hypothetical protein